MKDQPNQLISRDRLAHHHEAVTHPVISQSRMHLWTNSALGCRSKPQAEPPELPDEPAVFRGGAAPRRERGPR